MLTTPTAPRHRTRTRTRDFTYQSHTTFFLVITVFCLALATALARTPFLMSIGLVAGIVIFIVCLVNTEASIYVLIFSMLLSPEFIIGGLGGSSATTASRGVTLRTEDLLLVVLIFAWLVRMAVHKDLGLVRDTPLNRPIAYYVTVCVFATGAGLILGYVSGMTGFFFVLKYIEYFVVYFVAANYTSQRSQVKRYLVAMMLTALVVSIMAMAQIPSGERVSAPFEGENGEPNTLGGYLLFMGAVVAGLAMNLPQAHHRWLLIGLIVVMLIPFLFTLSRSSYLGLPLVYLALVFLYKKRRLLMIGLMALLAVVGAIMMPQVVVDRISYTFNQGDTQQARVRVGAVKLDTSTSERVMSWQNALSDVAKSPVFGFGVTGYGFLDAQYPRVMVETGILGLVTFFLLVYTAFKVCMQVFRNAGDPLYRGLAMGTVAGLVGLMAHGVGSNTFIIVRIMEPFWLVVGIVVSISKMDPGEQVAPA
ncbi:MAG: O-antigen ligase family protein [Candidatus Latescibacteria bacterium]|nr:O-antigen ligase family protein [Candidatus Latescibacterota bacterium]